MATEILFDFYNLLVVLIFGSYFAAIFGMGIILLLMLLISRASPIFIMVWLGFYLLAMSTLYLGTFVITFGFIISLMYVFIAGLRLFGRTT